jgi:hypothetical protein
MRLPVPIFKDSKVYREVELKEPTLQALKQAKKTRENGGTFKAYIDFFKYCVVAIDDVTDKTSLSELIKYIPIMNAVPLAQELTLMFNCGEEKGVEGLYHCPLCETIIRAEKTKDYDTSDYLSQLETLYYEEDTNLIHVDFEKSVIITDATTGEEFIKVESIDYTIPTLEDCVIAEKTSGPDDFDIAIFAQPIKLINGEEHDKKFKDTWLKYILQNIKDAKTLKRLNKGFTDYGLKNTFEKTCRECGKVFNVIPKTTNFFDYTLQSLS